MSEKDVTPEKSKNSGQSGAVKLITVGIIAVLIAVNSYYKVEAQEQAVVLRFGKFETIKGPGLNFKLPLVDKVYKVVTTEMKRMTFGYTQKSGVDSISRRDPKESLLLTGDANILDVRWNIQYRITDPKAWIFNVYDNMVKDDRSEMIDNREKTIRDISLSVINRIIGDHSLEYALEGNRNYLISMAKEEMNSMVKKIGLGITIEDVNFETVAAPEGEVKDAFQDVTAASVDKDRLIDEGSVYKSTEINKAKAEANKLREVADGYAIERTNIASGDVEKFKSIYDEYRVNKKVTRDRLYFEMMEALARESEGTDLIDKDLSNFIPLKNLSSGGAQ